MTEESVSESDQSSLGSIVDGATIFFVGEVLYKGSAFLLNLLLARALGTNFYGVYSYAYAFVTVSTMFAGLGSDQAVLRYLPKYTENQEKQNWVLGLSVVSTIVGSLLIAGGLYLFAPVINQYTLEQPLFVDVLRIVALILPLDTLTKVLVGVFRGIERPREQILLQKIIRPSARICAVVIALGIGLSFFDTVAALVVASGLAVVGGFQLLFSRTSLRPANPLRPSVSTSEVSGFFNYSLPLMLSKAGTILYNRIDVFMVGAFFSSTVVGYYNISFLLSSLISLPLVGCNQLFAPVASRMYDEKQLDDLNEIYSTITRWVFTVSLLAALGTALYAEDILGLIGPEYVQGTPILVLFAVGQLLNASVGPSNYLLMMTDHQYVSFINHWVIGVINVVLNYIFILQFGAVGAAIATASILGLLNIIRWIEIRQLEGLSPYSLSFYKPLVAGMAAAIALYIPSIMFSGLILLIVGGLLGTLVYASSLYLLGIEEADIQFFREHIADRLN
ncbi:flippase [Halocatena halophila]|uniref:flippase n=1 Tax=Halocatena halophila TaxID=2814576 RepID=UPI002ED5B487